MQTIISYQGTALPLQDVAVTLFNSVKAFRPGGSFHLLNQQWFQYSIDYTSGGAAVATVVGQYALNGINTSGDASGDVGAVAPFTTWVTFYTGPAGSVAAGTEDEVYVGAYKDVRFILTMTIAGTLTFSPNLALNDCKPSSKVPVGALLHPTPTSP